MITQIHSSGDQPEKQNGPRRASEEECIEQVTAHIERHIGKPETVLHEFVSDDLHIDVHIVPPTSERPVYTLVTSGMSCYRMSAPENHPEFGYAELMVRLPKNWPMEQEAFLDECNYWPIRCLKALARFPMHYRTWLGKGHTVPNGNSPRPYAPNTKLCCALILTPRTNREFLKLEVNPNEVINFYSIFPIYKEEMNLLLKHGGQSLIQKFANAAISDVINPHRKNVCKKRFGLF